MGDDSIESGSVQEKVKSRSNIRERNVSGTLVRAYIGAVFGASGLAQPFHFQGSTRQTATAASAPRLNQ